MPSPTHSNPPVLTIPDNSLHALHSTTPHISSPCHSLSPTIFHHLPPSHTMHPVGIPHILCSIGFDFRIPQLMIVHSTPATNHFHPASLRRPFRPSLRHQTLNTARTNIPALNPFLGVFWVVYFYQFKNKNYFYLLKNVGYLIFFKEEILLKMFLFLFNVF